MRKIAKSVVLGAGALATSMLVCVAGCNRGPDQKTDERLARLESEVSALRAAAASAPSAPPAAGPTPSAPSVATDCARAKVSAHDEWKKSIDAQMEVLKPLRAARDAAHKAFMDCIPSPEHGPCGRGAQLSEADGVAAAALRKPEAVLAKARKALGTLERKGALAFRDASEAVGGDDPAIAQAKQATAAAFAVCKDVEP
jgi:hypothetical protein